MVFLFYHNKISANGYHFDTYPETPQFEALKVTSIAEFRQNERGKFEPDYEFIKIEELTDPQH